MRIGENEIEEIIITDKENGVIAVVSDSEIIELEDYKVILKPVHKILS